VGNIRFIQELKAKRFELAIVLHPTKRSHMVVTLAGIPERIGYDRKAGHLLTKSLPHTKQLGLKHEIDYALDVLRYLGIEPKGRSLYMPLNSRSEQKAEDILKKNGVKDSDTLVVMNPGASCASKRWGVENFAKVADALAKRYGAKIAVIAGSLDKHFGDELASMIGAGCINLSGHTSVGDIASILKRARLFISNDSGPVHIGCAVGTPVIVIFGRSDRGLSPQRWGPSGKKDVVLHKETDCEICYAHNCKIGFKCLESITAEEVLEAAGKILTEGK